MRQEGLVQHGLWLLETGPLDWNPEWKVALGPPTAPEQATVWDCLSTQQG